MSSMGQQAQQSVTLADEDVDAVIQAIREGRVRTLDGVLYDPAVWNAEAVRDWLKRTHRSRRAKQLLAELRNVQQARSRSVALTTDIALRPLLVRSAQLEQEVAEFQERLAVR